MRVRGVKRIVLVALLVLLSACRRDEGAGLEITRFEANPPSVAAAGQTVTLSWDISGVATDLEISASVGSSLGSVTGRQVEVRPTATTTYTLTASNGSNEDEATATVTVGGGGGEDGNPPTGSFGVALTQTGQFQSDVGSNITSPSDPRIVRVQPGDTFYASASYSDPGGVSALTVYLANTNPPGLKADLVPGQSVGGFTVSEPTGCTLDGSQLAVQCVYAVQVGNIPNIDALAGAGNEFAYVFKVRAADPAGNSDDQSTRGYVIVGESGTNPDNESPVAAFTSEQTGSSESGVTYAFSAAGSSDPDGDSLSYAWNFGDGTSATSRDFNKTYTADGSYTVTLTVNDGNGGSDSVSETLTVDVPGSGNQPPVASFTFSPETVVVDETVVTFDGSASSDPDGTVASYAWTTTSPSGTPRTFTKDADDPPLRLNFTQTGTFTIGLVVTDDDGAVSEAVTQTLEVLEEVPTGNQLSVNVTGDGTVTSSPEGIDCPDNCTESYESGVPVTLVATPDEGAEFVGWGGACAGTSGSTCTVTMNAEQIVTATFSTGSEGETTLTFNQSTEGGGTGSVESNPAGISCDNECVSDTATYPANTVVTLTATPDTGSSFEGWTGDCAGQTDDTCTLTMNASKTVAAIFGLAEATSPIKADFEAVISGNAVAFTSTSEGSDIASYLWEFGDGLIGGGAETEHRYSADGAYEVKLTIRDTRRNRASISKDVVVPG